MNEGAHDNLHSLEPIMPDSSEIFDLIDSHCHLDFPVFDKNRNTLLSECEKNGINKFIVPGVTATTWPRLQEICENYSAILPAYGLHPYFLAEHKLEHIAELKIFLQKAAFHKNSAIAVGEIGLDYYLKDLDKKLQQNFFDAQLIIAKELNLPVILHVRKAHDDVLSFLKKHNVVGGAVHAFNGSLQQAHQYLDLGFKFGFGGALTFDKAKHLRTLVTQLPLKAILLETDSPDMLPANFIGNANTPLTILAVLKVISTLRNESITDIAKQATRNTTEIFNI